MDTKHDWHDMLCHSGSYKYPYRIQWCQVSGNVRARVDGSDRWTVENCCVNAKYALHIGYNLLNGDQYEKA